MTHPNRLRRLSRLQTGLMLALLLSLSSTGLAQDPGATKKKAPNVLLIVDTSGSMEYEAGLETFPTCDPTGGTASERSRWVDLVEVLTGTITNYRCESIDRASSKFTSLYALPGPYNPPDYDYRNNYHRPLSGTCAPTPDLTTLNATPNAFDFAGPAFTLYNDSASTCAFAQSPDGLIDSFTGNLRFGLMTFDTLPDQSVGFSSTTANYPDGIEGAWSYFDGTDVAAGRPIDCDLDPETLEVGARNGAAPAWEGKLIPFGNPDAQTSADIVRHNRIEQVLLSTRPYGATPIAGALTDAETFLTVDDEPDPSSTTNVLRSAYFGPKNDPYVENECRDQYIILLTDGEPNLDLRPHCEGTDEKCPYRRPEEVTLSLRTRTKGPVKTYVVGFAEDQTTGTDATNCNNMVPADWEDDGKCSKASTEELRVCCTLNEIAAQGGTSKAYFGENKNILRSALSDVFADILAGGGSATQPVRSPGVGDADDTGAVAFRILTSYEAGITGVWRGTVERSRFVCDDTNAVVEADKDEAVGDDFSFNVNSHPTARNFITYQPDAVAGVVYSNRSIRPNISDTAATDDGVGKNAGGTNAVKMGNPSTFTTALSELAIQPDLSASGPCAGLTAADCKTRLVTWFVGGNNGTGYSRCATAATGPLDESCSVIGDVMHSTPVIVDHPTAEIEDETYDIFRSAAAPMERPMMVYTSSNDGVLHGFMLSPNDPDDGQVDNTDSNELFAFIPPAILPQIDAQYPKSRQKLLDGVPVVQDVVATTDTANTYYGFKLERSSTSAAAASSTYRTILVQAFGGAQSGYFALDITDPTVTGATGPRLLWQLTTDAAGNPLFGEQGATPLITTLLVSGTETAVAVLPGGHASTSTGYCERGQVTNSQVASGYAVRHNVRCYNYDKDNRGDIDAGVDDTTYIGARSLTIVRLDTGEILARFRRNTAEPPTLATGKAVAALLDSPITGTPAAYPHGPGAVSDRIFVGDQDGSIWRVDTSSGTPSQWTMTLFFDTFSKHASVGDPEEASAAGRPIIVAPTLSVNEMGQVTLATATGDQDLSGGAGEEHYVWSLRETYNSTLAKYQSAVNWYQEMQNGEHVLGPLRLNEGILYYSSFTPETTDPCEDGASTVYAVDYLKPASSTDPSEGGSPRLSLLDSSIETALPDRATAVELGLPSGTVIFGINLEYAPSCFETTTPNSALLGGAHTSATSVTSTTLQLAFQTGSTKTSKEDLGFKTGFETIGLNRPSSGATIESWAAILE